MEDQHVQPRGVSDGDQGHANDEDSKVVVGVAVVEGGKDV